MDERKWYKKPSVILSIIGLFLVAIVIFYSVQGYKLLKIITKECIVNDEQGLDY